MNEQTKTPPTGTVAEPRQTMESSRNDSIPDLIRQLANDVSTLMTKEVALAKAEVREAANDIKGGIAGIAGGAALALSGLIILLMSAVYALDEVMDIWLAALIVGALAAGIGYAMVKAGQKKVEPAAFVPERTIDSVQKDKDMAKRATQ